MAKQILGKVVPIIKGTYNSSTQYAILDIVEYNGSSYIAKQNVQGQAPTNTTYWQLLASQGDKPVYKVDYLTDAEMAEIVNDIITDSTNAFNQNVTNKTTAFNNNATDKTNAFNSNATSKTNDFNSNATSKTTAFNNNAIDKTSDYNTNASSTKDDFDRNASSKTTTFNDNATSKTNSYNSNATDKTTAYNNNHTDKLGAYNDNASAKTTAFNENASEKTTEFNENAEAIQEELDYYKTLKNAFAKVNGTGESITLNDTANSPLDLELEPNISQLTTTGKNLADNTLTSGNSNGITYIVNNDKTVTLNGTATDDVNLYLNLLNLPSGTYKMTGAPSTAGASTYKLQMSSIGTAQNDTGNGVTFTTEQTYNNASMLIKIYNGTTLSNVVFKPMLRLASDTDETYEPYTNGASPNPDYPQDIHTISGDNTVKVENKNLIDLSKIDKGSLNSSGVYSESGVSSLNVSNDTVEVTTTTTYKGFVTDYIKVTAGVTYSLSYVGITTGVTYFTLWRWYDENKVFVGSGSGTAIANAKYLRLNIGINEIGTFKMSSIQLEKNSSATTYIPHQEQIAEFNLGDIEYCKIGDYKDEFKKSTGKNLVNLNSIVELSNNGITASISSNKGLVLNGTATANAFITFTLDNALSIGDVVSLSANNLSANNNVGMRLYQAGVTASNNILFNEQNKILNNYTIDAPYDSFQIRIASGTTLNNYTLLPQLEKGLTATEYEPYGIQWYLKKNIGKVVLDGSENNWSVQNTGTANWYYQISLEKNANITESVRSQNLCNRYIYASIFNTNTNQGIWYGDTYIRIRYGTENTIENYKTWLSSNNAIIFYVLATPTYTLLNNTLQSQLETIYNKLLGYQEQTNISQENNDLAFNIKAKAVYDLNKLVERVTTLENE